MVSLSLMASLLAAVRPEARLILVGDPEQLASVEAGAVLGDIVGPAGERALMRGPARQALAAAVGQPVAADPAPPGCAIGDGIVVLRRVHRFGGSIARLAAAIQAGEPETTLEVLASGAADVTWLPVAAAAGLADGALSPVREAVLASGRPLLEAARRGDGRGALQALGSFRLLCAHRRGPAGVAIWQARVEAWLSAEVDGLAAVGEWYVGRPLLVAENDYALGLFNGDTGVVVATPEGRLRAVFERRGELVAFPPIKLEAVETVHAMTVHKAQGSQFDTVALILPPADSPILTRELLYTAVTRARAQVIVAGEADAIRAAVRRPIARASGLRDWLWGGE
jgi:exodeoxyribonuclease V alpha subunit